MGLSAFSLDALDSRVDSHHDQKFGAKSTTHYSSPLEKTDYVPGPFRRVDRTTRAPPGRAFVGDSAAVSRRRRPPDAFAAPRSRRSRSRILRIAREWRASSIAPFRVSGPLADVSRRPASHHGRQGAAWLQLRRRVQAERRDPKVGKLHVFKTSLVFKAEMFGMDKTSVSIKRKDLDALERRAMTPDPVQKDQEPGRSSRRAPSRTNCCPYRLTETERQGFSPRTPKREARFRGRRRSREIVRARFERRGGSSPRTRPWRFTRTATRS